MTIIQSTTASIFVMELLVIGDEAKEGIKDMENGGTP